MRSSAINLIAIFGSFLVVSCVSGADDVYSAIEKRAAQDGETVTVGGTLKTTNGYFNLFSRDQRECIGLLLTDAQREEYRTYVGKRIQARGQLEAEGCGREGICVEHLCGPTILTKVTLSPPSQQADDRQR